jgi:hypothetical protein
MVALIIEFNKQTDVIKRRDQGESLLFISSCLTGLSTDVLLDAMVGAS